MTWFFLYEALAGAFFYSMFCRSVRVSLESTQPDVLLGLWVQAVAAVAAIAAPIVTGWNPGWQAVFLLAIVVTVQWVNSKHWRHGVPVHLQRAQRHANRI
jgi:hypothetical protein